MQQSSHIFVELHFWWKEVGVIILIPDNDKENEQLKKALINAYKVLERKYIENLKEIEKINLELRSL